MPVPFSCVLSRSSYFIIKRCVSTTGSCCGGASLDMWSGGWLLSEHDLWVIWLSCKFTDSKTKYNFLVRCIRCEVSVWNIVQHRICYSIAAIGDEVNSFDTKGVWLIMACCPVSHLLMPLFKDSSFCSCSTSSWKSSAVSWTTLSSVSWTMSSASSCGLSRSSSSSSFISYTSSLSSASVSSVALSFCNSSFG